MQQRKEHRTREPRAKRRGRQLDAVFEPVVCDMSGSKIRGSPFRRRNLDGDACAYRYSSALGRRDGPLWRWRVQCRQKVIASILAKRVPELLTEEERDLLMLIAVAGFPAKSIAVELNVHSSTVTRRYNRVVEKLRSDRELRRLLGVVDCDGRSA